LILDLQAERRLTAETVAGVGRTGAALARARGGTDRAVAGLRASAAGEDLGSHDGPTCSGLTATFTVWTTVEVAESITETLEPRLFGT
jgi:hypothetical protein